MERRKGEGVEGASKFSHRQFEFFKHCRLLNLSSFVRFEKKKKKKKKNKKSKQSAEKRPLSPHWSCMFLRNTLLETNGFFEKYKNKSISASQNYSFMLFTRTLLPFVLRSPLLVDRAYETLPLLLLFLCVELPLMAI